MALSRFSQATRVAEPVMTVEREPPAGPEFGASLVSFISSFIISGVKPAWRRVSWPAVRVAMSAPWPWSSQQLRSVTVPSGFSVAQHSETSELSRPQP